MDRMRILLFKQINYISGLSHSFLFSQHKSVNVKIDPLEFTFLVQVFQFSFEQLDVGMWRRLACTVFILAKKYHSHRVLTIFEWARSSRDCSNSKKLVFGHRGIWLCNPWAGGGIFCTLSARISSWPTAGHFLLVDGSQK